MASAFAGMMAKLAGADEDAARKTGVLTKAAPKDEDPAVDEESTDTDEEAPGARKPGARPYKIKLVGDKIAIRVFLLDNTFRNLLVSPNATVKDVIAIMASNMEFVDRSVAPFFGLFEARGGSQRLSRPLHFRHKILDSLKQWEADGCKFVFQCRLFCDKVIKSTDRIVIQLLFIQALFNVINGTYPVTEREACKLAACVVLHRFGRHNKKKHRPGFLTVNIGEYVPASLLEAIPKEIEEWERYIYRYQSKMSHNFANRQYLDLISDKDFYGALLIPAKQRYNESIPPRILLGASDQKGLLLFVPPNMKSNFKMITYAQYSLDKIVRWAFKGKEAFYVEIQLDKEAEGGTDTDLLMFDTPEGELLSSRLAELSVLALKRKGLRPDGSKAPTTDGDDDEAFEFAQFKRVGILDWGAKHKALAREHKEKDSGKSDGELQSLQTHEAGTAGVGADATATGEWGYYGAGGYGYDTTGYGAGYDLTGYYGGGGGGGGGGGYGDTGGWGYEGHHMADGVYDHAWDTWTGYYGSHGFQYVGTYTGAGDWPGEHGYEHDGTAVMTSDVPPGWTISTDPKTHATYYTNSYTGATQWERPTAAALPKGVGLEEEESRRLDESPSRAALRAAEKHGTTLPLVDDDPDLDGDDLI